MWIILFPLYSLFLVFLHLILLFFKDFLYGQGTACKFIVGVILGCFAAPVYVFLTAFGRVRDSEPWDMTRVGASVGIVY